LYINSSRVASSDPARPEMIYLKPDRSHLTSQMEAMIGNREWRMKAGKLGADYVRSRFTWKHTGDKIEAMFP